jgi:hypothetical protein
MCICTHVCTILHTHTHTFATGEGAVTGTGLGELFSNLAGDETRLARDGRNGAEGMRCAGGRLAASCSYTARMRNLAGGALVLGEGMTGFCVCVVHVCVCVCVFMCAGQYVRK